jgi:alkylation response protein AidB-like acyl-CoA dehydrogenase
MAKVASILAKPVAEPGILKTHGPGATGWLTKAEVAALTPEIVRERVTALKPMISEHAAEAERLGYPHPKVWDAIRATGFFYHFVPKKYGGCEFGVEDFFLTSRVIAEACASTGWAATFLVEHNWIASLYPEKAQEEFFANGRYLMAPAVSTPPGMATRVPGGYKVTGRWRYGSGVMHSDRCIGQALVQGDDKPDLHWMAFSLSDAQVLDTWHVQGLVATGSNDIVVNDLFVPEHMVVRTSDMQNGTTPGAKIHSNPIYRMPSTGFLALVTSAPGIGAARGAVEIFRERLKTRKVVGTQTILSEKPNMQIMLAKADIMVSTAELLLQTCAREVFELATRGETKNAAARMEIVARNCYAARVARDAVRLIIDNSGSSVHYLTDPLQRISRDVNVVCSHLIQDFESLAEQHGRSLLGLPPITYFF